MSETLILVWMTVTLLMMALMVWAVVFALKSALRRNEYLTSLLAVGNAHGGRGTDAARAQVAAVKELRKEKDLIAVGTKAVKPAPAGLRLKQTTP